MPNIHRVRVAWTGFPGAPGVSTFYALNGTTFIPHLQIFLTGVAGQMPNDVTLQIENTGDIIEAVSGDLMGSWAGAAQTPIVGSQSGAYSAPTGAVVNWLTGDVLDGHRLRGKTFLVPLANSAYDLTGSLGAEPLGAYRDYARSLSEDYDPNFVVWHRPRAAKAADGSRPAVTARAGGYSVVTGSSVPDECVVLRSRRD